MYLIKSVQIPSLCGTSINAHSVAEFFPTLQCCIGKSMHQSSMERPFISLDMLNVKQYKPLVSKYIFCLLCFFENAQLIQRCNIGSWIYSMLHFLLFKSWTWPLYGADDWEVFLSYNCYLHPGAITVHPTCDLYMRTISCKKQPHWKQWKTVGPSI